MCSILIKKININDCYSALALATKDISVCDKIESYGRSQTDRCIMKILYEIRDYSHCKTIKYWDNNEIKECEERILDKKL